MSEPPPLPPTDADPPAEEAPKSCAQCGSIHLSTLTQLPVCEPCRMALVRFPFPMWVKAAAALVAVMVVVSLALSQERMQAALHLAHAKKMLHQEKWEQAYQDYHSVIAQHGDTQTLLNYAEAAVYSGHLQEAAQTMKTLSGRQASRAETARANSIYDSLQAAARRAGPQQAWPTSGTQPTYLQTLGQQDRFDIQSGGGSSLSGFQLQQTPPPQSVPGSLNLNNTPIQLQTR